MANVALAPVESSSNTVNRVPPVYSRPDKAVFFRLARKELMPPKHAAIAAIIACNEQSFKRAELMEKTLRDTGLMFEHIRRGYPVNREEYMKWLDDDEIDYLFGYWNDLQRQGRAPIFDKEIHDSEFEYLRVALLRALGGQFRDQSSGKTVSSDLATTSLFSLGSGLEVHDSEGVATDLGEASQQTSSAQVVESFLAAQNQAPTQQEMNPLPIGHIRGRIGESFTSEASTPLSVLPDPRVFLSSAVQSVRRGDGSQTKPITIADGFDAPCVSPHQYFNAWGTQGSKIQLARCDGENSDQFVEMSVELSRKRPREHVSETKQAQKRCKQTDITKEVIDLTLDSVGDSIGLAVPSDCHVDVWDQFNMDNDMVPSFPANAAASASTVPNYVDWLHADAKDDPIDEYLKLHTTELYPVTNAPITGMASTLGGTYKSNRPATTRGYPRAVVNALDSSCSSASSQIQRPNQAFATHCRRDQKLGSNGYWSSPYSEGSTGIWTGLDESRYPHSVASDGWTNL